MIVILTLSEVEWGRTPAFSLEATRFTTPANRQISREAAQTHQPVATPPSTPANPSRQSEKY
jgi:hypothetical protein